MQAPRQQVPHGAQAHHVSLRVAAGAPNKAAVSSPQVSYVAYFRYVSKALQYLMTASDSHGMKNTGSVGSAQNTLACEDFAAWTRKVLRRQLRTVHRCAAGAWRGRALRHLIVF